jgi:hypothetical protein
VEQEEEVEAQLSLQPMQVQEAVELKPGAVEAVVELPVMQLVIVEPVVQEVQAI